MRHRTRKLEIAGFAYLKNTVQDTFSRDSKKHVWDGVLKIKRVSTHKSSSSTLWVPGHLHVHVSSLEFLEHLRQPLAPRVLELRAADPTQVIVALVRWTGLVLGHQVVRFEFGPDKIGHRLERTFEARGWRRDHG
jgi:hypothetical protein